MWGWQPIHNIIIVIAWDIQQTIVSENRIETFLADNLIKVGEISLSETSDNIQITVVMSIEIEITMELLSTELISQILLCIWIYTWGIINRHRFGGSHFQRNFISN